MLFISYKVSTFWHAFYSAKYDRVSKDPFRR